MNKFMKYIFILFYYLIANKLPSSFFPLGKIFNAIRIFTLKNIIPLGKSNSVQPGVYIGGGNNITIGSFCQINENIRLIDVQIGDYVLIAPNVQLIGGKTHNFGSKDIPMALQAEQYKGKIIIEDDVWIGASAIVLPGVIVGKGSIIGAGSIVTRNVEPFTIVAGNPAKEIKRR